MDSLNLVMKLKLNHIDCINMYIEVVLNCIGMVVGKEELMF